MLNKAITFIPAIATLLCVSMPAKAVNFHFGFSIPVGKPLVRPVYPVCPVPVYVAPRVVHYTVRHCAVDSLIHEVQRELNDIHTLLHRSSYRTFDELSGSIKNNWTSWVKRYGYHFGISRYDLQDLNDELHETRYALKRFLNSGRMLCNYEYDEIRAALGNLTNMVTSCRYRSTDLRDITMYFSDIQRILARA